MSGDQIATYGGVGGFTAVTEDLDAAVGVLRTAAGLLELAARCAGAAAVGAVILDGAPVSGAPAHAAAVLVGELEALATALAGAVQAYLDAELAALHCAWGTAPREVLEDVGSVTAFAGRMAVTAMATASPLGWLLTGGRPVERLAPRELPSTTALVNEPVVHTPLALLGVHYESVVSALAAALSSAEALEPQVSLVDRVEHVERPGAATLEQTMRRLAALEDVGHGAVRIDTGVDAHGRRVHTVYIPGTQDWTVWDANPADLHANPASVIGGMTDAGLTVARALEAHGVGRWEEVMLAGHSQGGMVAHVVAGALVGRYRVTQVVTAGSPTGRLGLPPGVRSLHLENVRDLVPGLDGARNPDTPERVTVVHDRREDALASDPSETVPQAHRLSGYADTAARVDRGLSPSTEAWREGAAGFYRPGLVRSATYVPVP